MESQITAVRVVTGLVVVTLVVGGPHGGVDLVASQDKQLGNGTASVTVVEPSEGGIRVTEGRFGTGVWYVRLPDLVVDVEHFEGTPRVQYSVSVPGLGIDQTETELVTSDGRLRVTVPDRPLAKKPANSSYRGTIRVRVQSLTAEQTVENRSMEVTVE